MQRKVAVLHTSTVFVNDDPILRDLFAEILPEVELLEFVDTDLLATVTREGCIAPAAVRRIMHLAQAAEHAGADVILSACSAIGPAIPTARRAVSIPIVPIDEPMARRAVQTAEEIGVLATLGMALGPMVELLEQQASAARRPVCIHRLLVPDAFEALDAGRQDVHDALVVEAARELATVADVIVPAQVGLARLAPRLHAATGRKVFHGPRLAVQHIKQLLTELPAKPDPILPAYIGTEYAGVY
jgi:Asp/Glu/hydantoin racemase